MLKETDTNIETLHYRSILKNIGFNIRQVRMGSKMNQNDLAFECNIEKAAMSRIESGKTNITFFTLCKIARALNLTVADLICDAEPVKNWKSQY